MDDAASTAEDTAVTTGNVLANDTDANGDTLSVESFTQASNGTVVNNGDGTFTYTPSANFNGNDSFTYTVSDGNGGTDTATVNVAVAATNDGPDAVVDTELTTEDTAVTTGNVLANDTDLDGDTLSVESFTQAGNGTVVSNGDGTFTYTPNANFNGSDSFTYTVADGKGGTDTATVNVTVSAANDGPVGVSDTASTAENTAVTTGNVLANDTDLEGDTLSIQSFTQAGNGTVVDNGDGTFTYTPNAGFAGTDSFDYTVTDSNGGTDTATVTVSVNAAGNSGPVAAADTAATSEDTAVTTGNVLANDTDPDGDTLSVQSFSQADNGTVVSNGDGTFTYTPNADFNGNDSFTYTVADGNGGTSTSTVNVTVAATNDAAAALSDAASTTEDTAVTTGNVLANDTDLDGDTLSVESFTQAGNGTVVNNGDGTFTYTPNADFNGSDSFTYTVTDSNGGTDTATVNVTVAAANDGPDGVNDTVLATEDTAITTGNVLTNDTDIDSDTLSVESFTQASNGTVVDNGDGTFTYTPDTNFNGNDSFTYTVADGSGGTSTAIVNVTVGAVNDGPVAVADSVTVNEDTSVTTGNVLANDTDAEGDTLSIQSFTQANNGTVINNGDGTFTYTPNADFNGDDSFTYTVTDGHGGTKTAAVDVTINEVYDAPPSAAGNVPATKDTAIPIVDVDHDEPPAAPVADERDVVADDTSPSPVDPPSVSAPTTPAVPETVSSQPEAPAFDVPAVEITPPTLTADPNAAPPVTVEVDPGSGVVLPEVATTRPDPDAPNTDQQDGAVIWDGTEDLEVLDPNEDFADSVDEATASDADAPAPGIDVFAAIAGPDYDSAELDVDETDAEFTTADFEIGRAGLPVVPRLGAGDFNAQFRPFHPEPDEALAVSDLPDLPPWEFDSSGKPIHEEDAPLAEGPALTDAEAAQTGESAKLANALSPGGTFAMLWSLIRGFGTPSNNSADERQSSTKQGRDRR